MGRKDWTLLVLAAAEGRPLQPVQLQKTMFLLSKQMPDEVGEYFYSFAKYHYGPFDAAVYSDAEALQQDGLAYVQPGPPWKTYGATADGIRHARSLANSHADAWKYICELVEWVRRQSFQSLLRAIYKAYPEYKENSFFRD